METISWLGLSKECKEYKSLISRLYMVFDKTELEFLDNIFIHNSKNIVTSLHLYRVLTLKGKAFQP